MKHILILLGIAVLGILLIVLQVKCRNCGGSGKMAGKGTDRITCSYCQGRGKIEPEFAQPSDVKSTFTQTKPTCPQCGGSGYVEEKSLRERPCPKCCGKGTRSLLRWILDGSGF